MIRLALQKIFVFLVLGVIFTLIPVGVMAGELSDVSTHWAKSEIQDYLAKEYIKGYPDGTFRPDNKISRAEFITVVNNVFEFSNTKPADVPDVKPGDWYASAIAIAKTAGYISGYPDGTMKPNNPISREEVSTIIMNIIKLEAEESGTIEFPDSKSFTWSKGAIGAVFTADIMKGYSDGYFRPQQLISRGESVVALNKALFYSKNNTRYDDAETYGPETGTEVVEGNAIIGADGVILRNMTINGNLTISKRVGAGKVTLNNVTVKGVTNISGGGENSIVIMNSSLGKVNVSKKDGKIRIVVSGSTKVLEVYVYSGVILEEKNLTGNNRGFMEVIINASEGDKVTLIGSFTKIRVVSKDVEIQVPKGTSIETLTIEKSTSVRGTGTILVAEVNANTVSFEIKPATIIVALGIEPPKIIGATGGGGGGAGGGGGGGPTNPETPVTPAAPGVTADDTTNTVTGMAMGMEYNLDGAGYVAYNAVTFAAIDFSGAHTLLVRVAAEGINPFGPDTTLTFTDNPVQWPAEMESASIIVSEFSGLTFVNINIKSIYEGQVSQVLVDGRVANKMPGVNQWRINIPTGTTLELLKGKIQISLFADLVDTATASIDFIGSTYVRVLLKEGIVSTSVKANDVDLTYNNNTGKWGATFNTLVVGNYVTIRVMDENGEVDQQVVTVSQL